MRLEETVRHPGKLGFQTLDAIPQHSGVLQRVLLGNAIGNALAIDDGFSIESKQCRAQFKIR